MEFWNHIIQTAMLGTGKRTLQANELPGPLAEAAAPVLANTAVDKEEQYLQLAAMALNYRLSGHRPVQQNEAVIAPSPEEDKPYCSPAADSCLREVLSEENTELLLLWLEYCVQSGQLVLPLHLPALLQLATQQKSLRPPLEKCMGQRGQWLCAFNDNWHFSAAESEEERWNTGTPEQRFRALQQVRGSDPALGRQWLQQTWPQENAAGRAELLKALYVNLGADEVEWLESLTTDKSKKVKEEAWRMLTRIPESSIVAKYKEVLQQAVVLSTEKSMLGLKSKTLLKLQLPVTIDKIIVESGIAEKTTFSHFTDDEYIIYQLAEAVPPAFWQQLWQVEEGTVLQYFHNSLDTSQFIPALATATRRFKSKPFALAFTQHIPDFYKNFIHLLPPAQQEAYCYKHFAGNEESVLEVLLQGQEEWSPALAKAVLTYTAMHTYQYNRGFYSKHIRLLPPVVAGELERMAPLEEYQQSTWRNYTEHIRKLLTLKQKLTQTFPSTI